MRGKLLLSGASGRIGRRLLEGLTQRGFDTVGLGLRSPDLRRADVTDAKGLAETLRTLGEVDVVLHLAALAHADAEADPDRLHEVNVVGTRNLYEAARETGMGHFVFFSSIDVYAPGCYLDGAVTEDSSLEPATAYGRTKAAAERYLVERSAEGSTTSILRLAPVYSTAILDDIRKRVQLAAGVGFRCAESRRRYALCHPDNVLEAVCAVLGRTNPGCEVYNVRDGAHATQRQILDYLSERGWQPRFRLPVPELARPGTSLRGLLRLLPGRIQSLLVKALGRTLLDISRLRAIGYHGGAGLAAAGDGS